MVHSISATMRMFAAEWGFEHVTPSPHFHQSNGFIERMVQTVKGTMKKCEDSRTDPNLALLCLRTTPVDHQIPSLAELLILFARKIKGNLPSKVRNMLPDKDGIYKHHEKWQEKTKEYYDQGARDLPELPPEQQVLIQDPQPHTWGKAVVQDKCPEPRSYLVTTEEGTTLRRNRKHIRAEPAENEATTPTVKQSRPVRDAKKPQRLIEEA